MAQISEYRKLSSKIEGLKEKIKFKTDILELDQRLTKEKSEELINKFIQKENEKLDLIRFGLSCLDEEVNKRLPRAMNKYNRKDYWSRREAIQTWRVALKTDEATKEYYNRLNELDGLKVAKENEIKEKLSNKLKPYIASTPQEREAKQKELDLKLQEFNEKLEAYKKEVAEKEVLKLQKLKEDYEKTMSKLTAQLDETLKAREELKNESFVLENDIVLKVNNLTMQFGGLKAVDNLSFEVKKGEIFGLIGPNGAGKTTVFNCITQFYKPTKGELYFLEKNGATISLNDYLVHDVIKKGIVRTFQNVEVIKEVSVLDNLLISAHTQYKSNLFQQFLHLPILKKEELAIKEKALDVLDFMGLSSYKNSLAWGLPYGILKKIEIARTLMNNPQLIILDEPAAGLNDTETAELTKLIRAIQEKYHCTILLVEHDMGLVMDICDTVCAISFGKLLAIGTPEEIQANKDVQAAYLGISEED